jgi:acetylornithine/N-succinyldiaminopimelate aminotransferase
MSTHSSQQLDLQYYLPVYKRFPLTLVRGEGAYVWDDQGKKYLDLLAGIAVNSLGHCHPGIVKAVQEQAGRLMHVSNFFVNEPQAQLSKRLVELSGLSRVFFANSGAEAVEGAIKLARKYASTHGRGGTILSVGGSFHGRTLGTIAAGKRKYQQGFDPIPGGFQQLPFHDMDAIKSHLDESVAAVMVEPVQGEGGVRPHSPEFLRDLRKLCDEAGALLIFDEVQCGIGRTGSWFAFQNYGVTPDVLALAKALGGGFPIGAVMCTENVSEAIDYGDHGTTFGGNPLACAAALATLDGIADEDLLSQAKEKGCRAMRRFHEAAAHNPAIVDVRGKGLMIGVELSYPGKEMVLALLEEGIIANCTADTVIRLVPPLNIPDEAWDAAVEKIIEMINVYTPNYA